jgi:hypothetical protein
MVRRVEVVSGVCKSGFGVAGIVKSVGDFFLKSCFYFFTLPCNISTHNR